MKRITQNIFGCCLAVTLGGTPLPTGEGIGTINIQHGRSLNGVSTHTRTRIAVTLERESTQNHTHTLDKSKLMQAYHEDLEHLQLKPHEYALKGILMREFEKRNSFLYENGGNDYSCDEKNPLQLAIDGIILELRYTDPRVRKIVEFQIRNNPGRILNMGYSTSNCTQIYDANIARILEINSIVKALDTYPRIRDSFDGQQRVFTIKLNNIGIYELETTIPTIDKFYQGDFISDNIYAYLIAVYPEMQTITQGDARPLVFEQR